MCSNVVKSSIYIHLKKQISFSISSKYFLHFLMNSFLGKRHKLENSQDKLSARMRKIFYVIFIVHFLKNKENLYTERKWTRKIFTNEQFEIRQKEVKHCKSFSHS